MLVIGLKKQNKKEQELFIQDEYYYYPLEMSVDFIGDIPDDLSYDEYMDQQKQEKLTHLKQIHDLMLENEYATKRNNLLKEIDAYTQKKNEMMQKVRDYEAAETERLGNEMAPIEDFNELYRHIDEMFAYISSSQEYIDNEAFFTSLKSDSILYDSLNYYLTEEDRGEVVNDDFHYGMIENFDYVIVDDHSYIISEAIEETENEQISENKNFVELYKYLKKPVKKSGPVVIGLTDEQTIDIIKEVTYKDLSIDDLCHLKTNQGILIK